MALHNFIRESAMSDADFDMVDANENFVDPSVPLSSQENNATNEQTDDDNYMNQLRDWIADGLFSRS